MAQSATPKLDAGDRFPALGISLVDGRGIQLPDDLTHAYTLFLGFRGKW